jgi:hypothetical protein
MGGKPLAVYDEDELDKIADTLVDPGQPTAEAGVP